MAFSLSKNALSLLEAEPSPWSVGPTGLRFVVAAVVSLLRRAERGELPRAVADEALLHATLSVDGARADRVHLRAQIGSRVVGFREVVSLLGAWPMHQVGSAVDQITTTTEGHFDVDAKEAFARVVSVYTLDYSNFMPYAPTVRRHFFNDPPAQQQAFLRVFLELFDDNTDVTALPGAPAAAAWLRAHRVFLAQHTLVLRDDVQTAGPPAIDIDAIERDLREAQADFSDLVTRVNCASVPEFRARTSYGPDDRRWSHIADDDFATDLSWLARRARTSLAATPEEHDAPLVELLTALHVPPHRRALQALATACGSLASQSLPLPYQAELPSMVAARPLLTAARDRLQRAAWNAWELAC